MVNNIRKAAVAGSFYPALPDVLREDVKKYLAEAEAKKKNAVATSPGHSGQGAVATLGKGDAVASGLGVNILIAPHAGYVFSAPVAASVYSRISRNINTVFIIGPSHRERFDGVHLTGAHYYETPLGVVAVNREIVKKLAANPLCFTVRGVEEKEHCLEVQLPFLQVLLDKFTIVPIITGNVGARAVSEMLLPFANDDVLIIASSDLSHYQSQERAREIDDATVSTILSGNIDGFMDGCGETAMRIVMDIAAKKGLTAEILDARTSYETAPKHGDSNRVVGYAAVAFVKPSAANGIDDEFTLEEKTYLLKLARKTLEQAVNGKDTRPAKPTLSKLTQNYGSFVTLNSLGQLRGCIGNIEPIKPLYKSVADNAVNAAFHDPRFPKVRAAELGDIKVEVSILTRPRPLEAKSPEDILTKLVAFEHGVILKFGGQRQSTFLPQVWEQLPNKTLFLEHLAMKAGMGKDDWKRAEVWVYRAVHFSE